MIHASGKKTARVWGKVLIALLCGLVLIAGVGCPGEAKKYTVGILNGYSFFTPTIDGFKEKMTELGYTEGDNVTYMIKEAGIDMEAYQSITQSFIDAKVDLILAFPTEASIVAKQTTQGTNIPVVFANAVTEDIDLIKSIQQPGGNVTGVRFPAPEISLRRFEVLLQIKPTTKKVFIPFLTGYPSVPSQSAVVTAAAKELGVTIEQKNFSSPPELSAFLEARGKQRDIGMDAIMGYAEPLTSTPDFMQPLFTFAAAHKIPVSDVDAAFGEAASTIGVMIDTPEAGRSAALLAEKILKGTSAGTIPVVTPENQLTINYRMTQKLGLTVPDNTLKQAEKVIR